MPRYAKMRRYGADARLRAAGGADPTRTGARTNDDVVRRREEAHRRAAKIAETARGPLHCRTCLARPTLRATIGRFERDEACINDVVHSCERADATDALRDALSGWFERHGGHDGHYQCTGCSRPATTDEIARAMLSDRRLGDRHLRVLARWAANTFAAAVADDHYTYSSRRQRAEISERLSSLIDVLTHPGLGTTSLAEIASVASTLGGRAHDELLTAVRLAELPGVDLLAAFGDGGDAVDADALAEMVDLVGGHDPN